MSRTAQHGAALVATLIVLLILGVTAGSLSMMCVGNSIAVDHSVRRAVALTIAEIGVERAKTRIATGAFDEQFVSSQQAVDAGTVYASNNDVYGSYAVHVTAGHGGVDGDYLVVSQGTSGRTTRQVSVVLRRTPPALPDASAAITLYNPTPAAAFRGLPPLVCGLDTAIPTAVEFSSLRANQCVPGSGDGPHAVGVGVHDDLSAVTIVDALGRATSRVTGVGPDGGTESASVYNVGVGNPSGRVDTLLAGDVADLVRDYESVADTVYDPAGDDEVPRERNALSHTPDLGTLDEPRVVVLRDSSGGVIRMTGNVSGAGVLVLDAPVEFSGTFNYAGLIIVTGRGTTSPSLRMRGTPLLMGALIAANTDDDACGSLDLGGTIDVFYSRDGLDCARRALQRNARFQTLFYTEQKPKAGDLEIQLTPDPPGTDQPW